jgi:RNA polymerase sigma-70 factor, ECF subfamily
MRLASHFSRPGLTPTPSGEAGGFPIGTSGESSEASSALVELLASASRGDHDAWRELVGMYGRRVFAVVYSRFRNRELAEELTQSVFATISVKIGSGAYTEEGRFESWLMRVAMNRVRDEARRIRRHATPTDPSAIAEASPVDDRAVASDEDDPARFRSLRSALARLPEADREIIAMRHHGQMSFKQMADALKEPVGTLLARHHRALRKLRELMENDESTPHSLDGSPVNDAPRTPEHPRDGPGRRDSR